jgi:PIN domain nuclease of toxin-antitoxin system
MKLLLDTHIFLWFINDDSRLSNSLRHEIKNSNNEIFLSVVSIWECVIKYQLGKLSFPEHPDHYLPKKRKQHLIKSIVIDENSLIYLKNLEFIHKDPFDRLLMCQSLQHNLIMVTEDQTVLAYPNIKFLSS